MTAKDKITSIAIFGRRWFEKTNGNTYHSLMVQVNGEPVHGYEFQYGYGSQYSQNAARWLIENGYLPEAAGPLSWYCRENGIALYDTVTDVPRKKDLWPF